MSIRKNPIVHCGLHNVLLLRKLLTEKHAKDIVSKTKKSDNVCRTIEFA